MPLRRLQVSRLLYWVAAISLFALAAGRRFSLPLDPIADPDTWGYLTPALHQLLGLAPAHEGRNFLYPGFLFLVLRLFGDFRVIVIVQHLLGLAAGGFLLLTWRHLRTFVPASRLSPLLHDGLGLIAAAIFLVAGEPIRAEMQLRPEGVCAFLFSLNLYFAIGFIARAFTEPRPPAVWFGILTTFTALLLCSVRPSFVFLALVPLLPVGIFFLRRNWFRQKIALAAGSVAGAALLLLPEHFLSRDDDIGRMFLPSMLFVVHADLIRDQMAEDVKRGANLPWPRERLNRIHDQLRAEIEQSAVASPGNYPSLGFSPDYLLFNGTSTAAQLAAEFNYDNSAICGFYRFYYWRTWRQRPLQMMRKVVCQMAIFYVPICPAYDRSKILSFTSWYHLGFTTLSQETYAKVWKAYPPAVEFMGRAELLAQGAPAIEQNRVVRKTLSFLADAYLALLAITFVLAVASLFWRDYRRRLGWLVALTLFVFLYNAAACLEVAIINSLEVPRYSTVQMFFTLLAEFLAAWLLFEFALGKRPRAETQSS
jgi:hypothetical protein